MLIPDAVTTAIHALSDALSTHTDSKDIDAALSSLAKIWLTTPTTSDRKIAITALDELYHSFKVFLPHRDSRKVCIFGSARTPSDDPDYQLAKAVSTELSRSGFFVITGAGDGIMAAGNEGPGPDRSFGLNIDLPFEQEPNPFIKHSSKLVHYNYFFLRKLFFIKESDATILCPGGFGTHDEGFELLTLIQTGRCAPRPLVLMHEKNSCYWDSWLTFVKEELLERQLISPDDMGLFVITSDPHVATKHICHFYSGYHSIFYREAHAFVRLNRELSSHHLQTLTETCGDAVTTDGIFNYYDQACVDSDPFPNKPVLRFLFNKKYGSLNKLIHTINNLN
tara:strand:- start:10749 stop:11759 length:1011 start_codon:yes stop_codon:yes gene_type:complete